MGLLDNISGGSSECIIICGFSNEIAFPQTSSQKEHGDRIQLSGRVFASCTGDPGFVPQHRGKVPGPSSASLFKLSVTEYHLP